MARPRKQGLEYFPFDCDFFADERMVAITGEFGLQGEIITVHLLCAVYRKGYFVEWGDLMKFKLMKELPGVSEDLLDNVVSRLVRWGFFDEGLFKSAGVLTSEAIQQTFFSVARKRVATGEFPHILGFRGRNNPLSEVSAVETRVSDAETPQSKGKERKIKNTPDGVQKEPAPPSKIRLFSFEENVDMCLQDQVWRESVQMNLLVKITDWQKVFTDFLANLIANGSETDKTRQDFRNHFTSWLRKKQNGNGKNQENMAGNDRTGVRASHGKPIIAPATVVPVGRGQSCI